MLQNELLKLSHNECLWEIEKNSKFYSYFKNAIGAINGTHIQDQVLAAIAPVVRNWKSYLSQNDIVACTFDMYFALVRPGWEGSTDAGQVLNNAYRKGFNIPEDKY